MDPFSEAAAALEAPGVLAVTPFYDNNGVTLYCGDARDIIGDLTCTRLITDPVWPNALKLLAGSEAPYQLLADVMERAPDSVHTVVVQLGRASDPRFLSAVPPRWPFICVSWLRYAVPGFVGRVMNSADVAYAFGALPPSRPGVRVVSGECTATPAASDSSPVGKVRAVSREAYYAALAQRAHPTPRRVRHVEWLVERFSAVEDVVLDPFAGSGTTLVAARRLGRRAIGIELEERYCEVAVRRLAQTALFQDAVSAP